MDEGGDGSWDRTERYAYDGQNIVLVFDGSGAIVNRYLQTAALDQTLAEETPGQGTRWLLPDNQGTIRDVVDGGSAQTHLTYSSFGQILAITGSFLTTRFTYTGREWDADARLFYYRARWYDPATGRFLSQDPIGFAAGDTDLYRYVGNNPSGYTDPTGYCAEGGFFDWFSRVMMGDDPTANAWVDGAISKLNGAAEDIKQLMRAPGQSLDFMARMFAEEGNSYAEGGNVAAATVAYMAGTAANLLGAVADTAADPNPVIGAALADPRVQGILMMAQGGTEFVLGGIGLTTTGVTGVGAVVSGLTMAHGLDTYLAGLDQLLSGEQSTSLTVNALTNLTGSAEAAQWIDSGISAVLSLGTSMAIEGAAISSAEMGVRSANTVSVPQSAPVGQVAYRSTDLGVLAAEFREGAGIAGGRNIAVIEFQTPNGLNTVTAASARGVGHAERIAGASVLDLGIDPSAVTRIYSELQPCNLPGGYCAPYIQRTFPNAQVTWSFEYGTTLESRQAGLAALKQAIEASGQASH